jgi:hypothetical protein
MFPVIDISKIEKMLDSKNTQYLGYGATGQDTAN